MKIRVHRALLSEAMETVQEIEPTKDAIMDYLFLDGVVLRKCYNKDDIEVKPYMYDSRIDWDTYIVTLKGDAVAFTDGPLVEQWRLF